MTDAASLASPHAAASYLLMHVLHAFRNTSGLKHAASMSIYTNSISPEIKHSYILSGSSVLAPVSSTIRLRSDTVSLYSSQQDSRVCVQ